jgi:hypothetical protein
MRKGHRGGGDSWGLSGRGCPRRDAARGKHAHASWVEPLRQAPRDAVCRRRGGAWQSSSSGGDWSGDAVGWTCSVRVHSQQAGVHINDDRCSAKAGVVGSMRLVRHGAARKAGGSCALQKAAPSSDQVALGTCACDRRAGGSRGVSATWRG